MLLDTTDVETAGTLEGFTPSRIDESNFGLALDFFASIYSRPRDAVLRELAANGVDAQRDAGYDGPVEITLPSLDHPNVTVTDHGTGMDADDLTKVFGEYLASTKRNSASDIGGFGVGSKTPFSVADQFHVTSVKDGIRHLMIFAKQPGGGTGHKIVASTPTDEPSGTSIIVPVGLKDHDEWHLAARRVFYWWNAGAVTVDGDPVPSFADDRMESMSTDQVTVLNNYGRDGIMARINGVGYTIPNTMIEAVSTGRTLRNISAALNADDAPVTISRSRETIDDTDAARAWLETAGQKWLNTAKERSLAGFAKAKTILEVARIWDGMPSMFRSHFYSYDIKQILDDLGISTKFTVRGDFLIYEPGQNKRNLRTASKYGYQAPICEGDCKRIADALILSEAEFTDKVKRALPRWRKGPGAETTLLVAPTDTTDLDRMVPVAEQSWITAEQLLAQTPKPEKKTAKVTLQRAVHISQSKYGKSVYSAVDLDDLRASGDDGQRLIAGTVEEILDHRLNLDADVVMLRGTRNVDKLAKSVGHPILTPAQAHQEDVDIALKTLTPAVRRGLVNALQMNITHWDLRALSRLIDRGGLSAAAKRLIAPIAEVSIYHWTDSRDQVLASRCTKKSSLKTSNPLLVKLLDLPASMADLDADLINAVVAADAAARS